MQKVAKVKVAKEDQDDVYKTQQNEIARKKAIRKAQSNAQR